MILLMLLIMLYPLIGMGVNSDIDYEDIYDNIDDYKYPYNHINIKGV